MNLKKYAHDAPYTYAFGVFPTLELLRYQPRHVEQVLLSSAGERNEGVTKIRALCEGIHIPVSVNDKLVGRLSPKDNTYAIGVVRKYHTNLNADANHVVLVSPGDMGNLGTTLRTLVGFGITDLALVKPAVDIFDPRVVRASMGAVFQITFAYYNSFGDYCAAFKASSTLPLHDRWGHPFSRYALSIALHVGVRQRKQRTARQLPYPRQECLHPAPFHHRLAQSVRRHRYRRLCRHPGTVINFFSVYLRQSHANQRYIQLDNPRHPVIR